MAELTEVKIPETENKITKGLLIGVAISLVSSFLLTGVQAHYERATKAAEIKAQQRVDELKELAKCIARGEELQNQYRGIQFDLTTALENPSKENTDKVYSEAAAAIPNLDRWVVTLQSQRVLINALFEYNIKPLKLMAADTVQPSPKVSTTEDLKTLQIQIQVLSREVSGVIDGLEKISDDAAKYL